jgi:hypothetical protein
VSVGLAENLPWFERINIMKYYFPVCQLLPGDGVDDVKIESISIVKRRWGVSFFDLATLAVGHDLKMPYELMNVYFQSCNMEVCLEASSLDDAYIHYKCLRALFYARGLSPYISPCVMSHSLNEIAGINTRDSKILKSDYEELNEGITSKDTKVEIYPLDLGLQMHALSERESHVLSKTMLINSAWDSIKILKIYRATPEIRNIIDGLIAAPKIEVLGQSLLHIWTILESLFPTVQTEVSFRLALYISCMVFGKSKELFYEVKKSYNVRSRVAHGSARGVSYEEWKRAWNILRLVSGGIMHRGMVPTEEMIIDTIFSNDPFRALMYNKTKKESE